MESKRILFLLLLATAFFSCKNEVETIDEETKGYDYFPLEIGKNIVYLVDSIIYDTTSMGIVVTQSSSFIKEEIVDTLRNNTNDLIYRIERFERYDQTDPWQIQEVWSSTRNDVQAERTESNLRFIKMLFPLTSNDNWDGTAHIDNTTIIPVAGEGMQIFKSWSSDVISIDEPEEIGSFSFDEVTTISHADDSNLIEYRYNIEKYAKGIGLVYRELKILDTQVINDALPWEEKAQKGFIIKQTIISHN